MTDKVKQLILMTEKAMNIGDEALIVELLKKTMNEYLIAIHPTIFPINPLEVPYVIAALEMFAQSLRDAFPDACEAADDLGKLPRAFIRLPVSGGTENDR